MPGMIVAPQPEAVEQGAKVLAAGGNAFDAALACAWIQFLVDPHSCGAGGYLLLNCWLGRTDEPLPILDAPALAGSRVRPEMWESLVIGPNPGGWGFQLRNQVNEDGYQSICTPGAVLGLETIHSRWCSRPWPELLQPAIELAEVGWQVSASMATRWRDKPHYYETTSLQEKLAATPEASRIYLRPNGSTYEAGDRLRNPDYGRTLQRLAREGPQDFYLGEMAREMASDLEARQSWITTEDLAQYQVRDEPPVVAPYRDLLIHTAPAPHGGPTLAAILNILEGYDLARLGHNSPAYIHLVSMAMKAAFADRNRYLGDPHFVKVPQDWLVSKERARQWREVIDSGRDIEPFRVQTGSTDTTHISVVDRWGNRVSLTHSLGTSSGVITPGLGFMYNNSMINFHPYAGHPNSIEAGKGRTTGMTPTIVSREGKPILVVGAPGATRIITAVLSVILNHVDFGMSVTEAVLAPRFDCQVDDITCQARIPEGVCAEVRKKHPIQRMPVSHGGFALVHAIGIDSESGLLSGAADSGADGMALRVEDDRL
ncbi:MAG: gamma-glutamyltransferase family protein [Acidobacteria bacterium]|nr:gamma-glutamyltransferase family protein [Acidobacteriota bacterium]